MILATLCYIKQDGRTLMIHPNKLRYPFLLNRYYFSTEQNCAPSMYHKALVVVTLL